jgi:hypothetical protein
MELLFWYDCPTMVLIYPNKHYNHQLPSFLPVFLFDQHLLVEPEDADEPNSGALRRYRPEATAANRDHRPGG